MIVIDEDVVRDLMSLSSNKGSYMRLVKWLDRNFHEINDALNHLDPSSGGINFNEGFHYRRGFVAALDTLRHLFSDPAGSIPMEESKAEPPMVDNPF